MTSFSLPIQSKRTLKASSLWCVQGCLEGGYQGSRFALDHTTPVMASAIVTLNPEAPL